MAYGVYFSGKLQKAFIYIGDARKFVQKAFEKTRVKTITLSELNPDKKHLWKHKL
ncbi:MAG: hypothetical protein Q8M92_10150 [Candidatus Subteraquimicrobiales bacterium]|nr:hypothetical protein [Candidatus Subteraquimicrobiales bacterium]